MVKSSKVSFIKYVNSSIRITIHVGETFWSDLNRCDVFKHASAMAYVTLLSLVPSLAATLTIVSLFQPILGANSDVISHLKVLILDNLAAGSGDKVVSYLDHFLSNLSLGKIGATGFAGVSISLILLLRQIEIALNRIWLVTQTRNAFSRFIYFTAFLMISSLIIGIGIGAFAGGDFASLNPFKVEDMHRSAVSLLAPKIATLSFFVALYKVVPNRNVSFLHAIAGAIPATIALSIASKFYGTFTASFTNYTAIYGALAAIPVFLLWLYVVWTITLVGGVIAWRAEQGLDLNHFKQDALTANSSTERHRNLSIEHWLPIVCLIAIYHRYLSDDSRGISGKELVNQLHLPDSWIREALRYLRDKNRIVVIWDSVSQVNDDDLAKTFFPASPPEAVSVEHLKELLQSPFHMWLDRWGPTCDFDAKLLLSTLADPNRSESITISDLLKKVSRPASS